MRMGYHVYLALGSNVGDRLGVLRAALERVRLSIAVDAVSSVWDTAPELVTEQPRFLNAVVGGWTQRDPFELLAEFKRIERDLGRTPGLRYGPRALDIDLLLYDAWRVMSAELDVPHPRMGERVFVLAPLAEIAPDLRPLSADETVYSMLARVAPRADPPRVVASL